MQSNNQQLLYTNLENIEIIKLLLYLLMFFSMFLLVYYYILTHKQNWKDYFAFCTNVKPTHLTKPIKMLLEL